MIKVPRGIGIVTVFLIAGLLLLPATVSAREMTFSFQEQDLRPTLDLFQWIYADGDITDGTAARFKTFVEAHPQLISNATVILNSPGGSLVEGLRLGEAISERKFRTDVATSGSGPMSRKPAICASACVFAYLGGQYRYLTAGSQIGIHRFRFTKEFGGEAATTVSQLMAGELVRFIQKMRADTGLFTMMTQTSADDIKFLSFDQLKELKVVTNDIYSESWTFEVRDNIPYLKADQVTWRGESKLMFVCPMNGRETSPFVMGMSEFPDRETIVREAKQVILFVDHKEFYLPLGTRRPTLEGGRYVSWSFTVSPSLIDTIQNATSLGSGLSIAPGIFSGFEAINVGEARPKLVSFLNGCKADQKSTSTSPAPMPGSPPAVPANSSASSDLEITKRVARNFDVQYKKAGMNGLQLSVAACYAAVSKNRKLSSLQYCYLLDWTSSSMDSAVTKKLGYPLTPYWLADNVQDRAAASFRELSVSESAASQTMTRWQNLEPLIWGQLAAGQK